MRLTVFVGLLLLWLIPASLVQARDVPYAECLKNVQTRALDEGIPPAVVAEVLDGIEPIERVIASDRKQPEFATTFSDYYSRRVNQQRIDTGRALLQQHRVLLKAIETRYGIPAHYLVALWGLETNFGNYFGTLSIPAALTTLACDSRRAEFFTSELISVLRIIAAGDMTQQQLIGSWAGAIGHMQFMPSTFLGYAVDGDGDGKRNLMNLTDALTSGGAYLQSIGWERGYRWGREVRLPKNFDYSASGSDQWQSLSQWRALGVTDAFGRPVGTAPIDAALLLPAGHTGPAFLVYSNYKIILQWNRSQFYAISVGRLADRIAGAGALQRPLPPSNTIALSRASIERLQTTLNNQGFDAGKPDGVMGPGTSAAVRRAEKKHGLLADGYPDSALFGALNILPTPADAPN